MAGISLQDLKKVCHITEDQLDMKISDEHLREVSRIIDDHNTVGPELGLTPQEMAAINHDAKTMEHQKMTMLTKWKQKFAWKATYKMLIEANLKCSRGEDAQKVCELLTQSE